jgi:hypothetical protein
MRSSLSVRRIASVAAVTLAASVGLVASGVPAGAVDPCAPGGNPIVCENSKPGTDPTQWDIVGAGSSELQGFATDISVNAGSPISFKIDTSSSAYTIEIYRTGWYQGLGARHIASVTPSAQRPQTQPSCLWDITTETTDCSDWAVSATWNVPSDAVSGVYVALLGDSQHDWWSHITFVVRNDASHSDVVFQTSDTTWQAYNTYGGSDYYQGASNGRAYKISYDRPVTTRGDNNGRDFYFSSEYAMVRFLERNGYDVTYLAGVDSDRYGSLLLNHKTFLSVGHDEYWTGNQRANVEAARDAGVNLAFFSGNEVYWRTRFATTSSGSTDYRNLISYKETWANAKIDPSSEWTGTWRDPRFASAQNGGGSPENALTGTMYMSNFSDLAVTVSAAEGKYRIWRNTSLASMTAGTTTALAAHTIGYESNEDVDNGFRPAGLVHLSTTVGAVPQYLEDYGNVVSAGTTTHHLTMYRAPSGALVFSAGTIQWAWGLDQTHDGDGAAADARMQQATVNVLADMGSQPGSLMSGLVASAASTDTVGPTVTITSPAAGAALANGTTVTVTGTAVDLAGKVAGVEVSTDGGTTWHPATGTASWSYSYVQHGSGAVSVRARATDDSANTGATSTVTATASCPCSLYGDTVPATADSGDGGAVELGLRFSAETDGFVTGVRFYKSAANTGTHVGSVWSSAGQLLGTVTFTSETASGWQTAVLAKPVAVTAGQTYVVSYSAPAGHYAYQSSAFWYGGLSSPPLSAPGGFGATKAGVYGGLGQFPSQTWDASQYYVDVVLSLTDTSPLTVTAWSPVSGASSVATGATVSAVLSRGVTGSTPTLALSGPSGAVAGTSAYDSASRTITFTPAQALDVSTTYTATVTATDLTGPAAATFTTVNPNQGGGATISFYDDTDVPSILEAADYQAVTVGVRFASSQSGSITGLKFYKGAGNTGTHVGTLWAVSGGTKLAEATFVAESASGWQTVTFASPVPISKDTEYVAAYRTEVGRYSATLGAFSGAGLSSGPLRTASDSGAFTYGTGYPSGTSSSSYYVDVLFQPVASPATVVSQTPAPGATDVAKDTAISLTMSKALATGASIALATAAGPVAGTSALSGDGTTLTFTPATTLEAYTTYTVTAGGLTGVDGSTADDVTWAFRTKADAGSTDGCPCSVFSSETPVVASANDTGRVELGMSFVPTVGGQVAGVRFYKGAGNTGTHTGTLWSSTGTALRTVTFTGETATGWQTATFDTPYVVTAGTTYVVSYLAPQGGYSATLDAFSSDLVVGPLTVPAVGNGRYRYGGGFPTDSWRQSNYFVDVIFAGVPTGGVVVPTVVSTTPADAATDVDAAAAVSAVLSAVPTAGTPTLALSGPSGAVAGTSAWDASTLTVTFTPSAALAAGTAFSAAVSLDGTALTGGAWTFTTATSTVVTPTTVSLWADTDVPAVAAWDDFSSVQVGTRFTTSVAGTVTAIRFYKGAVNTGAHTVKLWGPDQTLLAEAASTAETASGWQTVLLPTPVALTPGAVYTAAYQSVGGRYSVTGGGLTDVRTSGPLSTVATGGAYVYGDGSSFPGGASSAWYGVDVVFLPES